MVSMSAASNVSGILTDTEKVAEIAHRHGALAIFDYASGGMLKFLTFSFGQNL